MDELKDLFNSENNLLLKVMPKMQEESSSGSLQEAFEDHQAPTEKHSERLSQMFSDK